ncbi:phage major capsid protein [Yersinia enterocolitica]|nr:phage major capsid protein [Yersinia enterocolitica]
MNELKPFDDALTGLIASLTPKARKALAVTIAKRLRASQQQRIKRQQAPDGTPYAARKSQPLRKPKGRIKREMFAKLRTARYMKANSSPDGAVVEFASLDSEKYFCEQVNYDFHIRYSTLDMWARYLDFQTRLRDAIIKRQALDRIMAGFNGTHRAKTSNRLQFPMLEDLAVGWLQKYRNNAPARVMNKVVGENGELVSDKIRVGEGGDYVNLDALVMDAANTMIAEWYQEDPGLVVLTGRNLMQDKYFPLVNRAQENSESLAADMIISQKRIGNLPAVSAPYFPANAFMITRLDNLSIYWLEDSHRRHIDEVAKRDRIENYESIKEDYVVEDYAGGCLVENIEILPLPKKEDTEKADKSDINRLTDALVDVVKAVSAPTATDEGK